MSFEISEISNGFVKRRWLGYVFQKFSTARLLNSEMSAAKPPPRKIGQTNWWVAATQPCIARLCWNL